MTIDHRAVESVTILDMAGRMALGDDIAVFRKTISGLVAEGHKMVLLNLRDVPYIDSSGIGELVAAFTNIRNAGGELKLLNLTRKVRTLLEVTKLYTLFDVKEDEITAIHAFSLDVPSR